jgi:hypothetical protein
MLARWCEVDETISLNLKCKDPKKRLGSPQSLSRHTGITGSQLEIFLLTHRMMASPCDSRLIPDLTGVRGVGERNQLV